MGAKKVNDLLVLMKINIHGFLCDSSIRHGGRAASVKGMAFSSCAKSRQREKCTRG